NDNFGHAAGDHVLQRVAEIMVDSTRSDSTLVRAGGDEFILIFPGSIKPHQLSRIAERLIEKIEEPIPFGKVMCRISGSIGISVVPEDLEVTASEVLEEVDQALYSSKNAGRGRATFVPLKAA
ncbi:MAG: GGDEF domain-containing protein, partial [Pseudomonadota bacterium]